MRSAPIEDLVVDVGDGGKCAGAPAEDAVVDLEPAADGSRDARPVGPDDFVASQRFADRKDVSDRHAGWTNPAVVAPGVAQVRDDEMACRADLRQRDRERVVDEDEPGARSRPKGEPQTAE